MSVSFFQQDKSQVGKREVRQAVTRERMKQDDEKLGGLWTPIEAGVPHLGPLLLGGG